MAKKNNRLLMSKQGKNDIRCVRLLKLKKKYCYMTGGSRRKFLIGFALGQLKSHRKSGFGNKFYTKPGSGWTITSIGQKNDHPLEDNLQEHDEESESMDNFPEENDFFDDHFCSFFKITSSSYANLNFSVELRDQFENDSGTVATPSPGCPLETHEFTLKTLLSSGFLRFLKKIEEHVATCHCHHAPVKDLVLRGSLDGTTPLLLACHYGDLKTVKYLVEKWGVGVNATAVYYRGCKIEEATPVFVASYSRRYNIVEYLIENGADLSLKTTSGCNHMRDLTPLLGAIRHYTNRGFDLGDFRGHEHLKTIVTPLVRLLLEKGATLPTLQDGYPIWTGLASYSAELTTLLVHHGMALDQQGERGETALHSWSHRGKIASDGSGPYVEFTNEEDSLTVVKLLVKNGANIMIRNTAGNTPIMTAVRTRNWTVVDFLMENDRLDRTEEIDAMELAAAKILRESQEYDSHVQRAFKYLRRAFILREEQPEPLLKTPLTLENGRSIEWTTIAEAEAGIQNPTEYKIQAYLTRLRICSGGRSISDFCDPLSDCISYLLEQRRFDDIRDVLWITLDASRINVGFSNSERSDVTLEVVKHLISMMSQLEKDHQLFIAETLKKPLEFLVEANPFFECHTIEDEDRYYHRIFFKLFTYLARNSKLLIDEDIKESLRHLVSPKNRLQGFQATFLHKACLSPDDLSTIRLLLLSGANPNGDNHLGNGPLHILATQYRRWLVIDDKVVGNAAQILLNNGAHLCKVNRERETAADVWRRVNGDLNHYLPDWLREDKFPKLSCQSARVITSQNIHYDDFKLPAILHTFVEAHRIPNRPLRRFQVAGHPPYFC